MEKNWVDDFPVVDPQEGFGTVHMGYSPHHNTVIYHVELPKENATAFLQSFKAGKQIYYGDIIPDPPEPTEGAPESEWFAWYFRTKAIRTIVSKELAAKMKRKNNSYLRKKIASWKKEHK